MIDVWIDISENQNQLSFEYLRLSSHGFTKIHFKTGKLLSLTNCIVVSNNLFLNEPFFGISTVGTTSTYCKLYYSLF
jgi:hypothetical protein